MSNATAYLTVAAMYALRAAAASQAMPATRADFAQLVETRYGWRIDESAIEKIIRQLDAWGLVTIITDKYAGEMLRVYRAKTDEALQQVSELGHQPLVATANVGGVDWFKKVFNNTGFWEDLHRDAVPTSEEATPEADETNREIPASDRIVTRQDNRVVIEVLEADFRGLVDEIQTNNEASVELGDDKDVVIGELKTAEVLVAQPVFRLSRLSSLVLPALRFLAEKFSAGAIGEMAKRLIAAIFGLA